MMAMTTKSSINVKACRPRILRVMVVSLKAGSDSGGSHPPLARTELLRKSFEQFDQGQEQRDYDRSDGEAEEDDHDRFEQ